MAKYAENNWYFDIDGTSLGAYLLSISLSPSQATNETTAGSGTDNVTRAAGLKDHSISFDIYHDDAAAYAISLLTGTHTITYGVEGNATGKPKHVQSFVLTGLDHTTNVNKEMVVYSVSGEAAAAPTTDMHASGVWS